LGGDPVSNAEVLFDEIREMGYAGGRTILKEFLHPFREVAKEKATVRFETPPGRQAQVDWGIFKKPARKRVQGFVLTLGWSRAMYLDFTETQALASFLLCHEQAFHYLGGVPEECQGTARSPGGRTARLPARGHQNSWLADLAAPGPRSLQRHHPLARCGLGQTE
jgi:transposase